MAQKVPSLNPKDCENGVYWDSITIEHWLDHNTWFKNARKLLLAAIRVLLGCELN